MISVLLLEDDQVSAMLLQSVLEESGYKVVHAVDTDIALSELEKFTPDLFLSDWRVDGTASTCDVARSVRKRNPAAKIAFVTGYSRDHLEDQIKEIEPVTVFVKPIDFDQLIAKLPSLP